MMPTVTCSICGTEFDTFEYDKFGVPLECPNKCGTTKAQLLKEAVNIRLNLEGSIAMNGADKAAREMKNAAIESRLEHVKSMVEALDTQVDRMTRRYTGAEEKPKSGGNPIGVASSDRNIRPMYALVNDLPGELSRLAEEIDLVLGNLRELEDMIL
jgi:hypothetical protein